MPTIKMLMPTIKMLMPTINVNADHLRKFFLRRCRSRIIFLDCQLGSAAFSQGVISGRH